MKNFFKIITMFFFIFLVCFNAFPAEKQTGPRILIEEPLFDAKEVMQGEKIQHTFKVLNTGDEPLEINKVHPG